MSLFPVLQISTRIFSPAYVDLPCVMCTRPRINVNSRHEIHHSLHKSTIGPSAK